jgi:hypothetical protein
MQLMTTVVAIISHGKTLSMCSALRKDQASFGYALAWHTWHYAKVFTQ